MKQIYKANNSIVEMNRDELKKLTGGTDITDYVKCVAATLTSGGGGVRTLLLGTTIFGMARTLGVMVGCL